MTDPEWAGQLGIAPTNASFLAFVAAMILERGEDGTRSWLEALAANDPVDFEGNSPIVEATDNGELEGGLVNHYYLLQLRAEGLGDNAENYFIPAGDVGSLVMPAGVGILSQTERPESAQQLVDFLLSDDAQTFFATDTFEYPLVDGIDAAGTGCPHSPRSTRLRSTWASSQVCSTSPRSWWRRPAWCELTAPLALPRARTGPVRYRQGRGWWVAAGVALLPGLIPPISLALQVIGRGTDPGDSCGPPGRALCQHHGPDRGGDPDRGWDRAGDGLVDQPHRPAVSSGLDDTGGASPGRPVLCRRLEPHCGHRAQRGSARSPDAVRIRRRLAGALGVHRTHGSSHRHPRIASHRSRHRRGGDRARGREDGRSSGR